MHSQKHVDESELHKTNLKEWREQNVSTSEVVNPLARGGATRLWALKPGETRELPPPSVRCSRACMRPHMRLNDLVLAAGRRASGSLKIEIS